MTLNQKTLKEPLPKSVDMSPRSPGRFLCQAPSHGGATPTMHCQPRSCLSAQPHLWNLEGFPKQYSIRIKKSHLHTAHCLWFPLLTSPCAVLPKNAFRAHETSHNHYIQGSALGSISEWNWDQFLLILDLPGCSPPWKSFLVALSPVCSPKDAQESILGSPSWFFSLR